ncbi:PREDICTED: probable G-protein coupled receptor Mth-like 1 [Ceratosolen solmsi marchali]|uniref:Probable G-protein coupled receptor Mth-like 1 n=1 Tax=Ceratosolen solmsi marchali TaxID=326594 RepID=A0AAJ6YLV2_9HYME|nr:PREDICTED: probable G-protein coupled receptor Mth-like 1 [Ceratosolen solmsi marchali]
MAPRALAVLALLLALAAALEVNDSASGSTLSILRCCRAGEDLEKPIDPEAEVRCVPSTRPFQPLVYSPEARTYLTGLPATWTVLEAARPACPEPRLLRYVPHSKYNPFVLFDFGEVVLEAGTTVPLKPDEFCLGSNTLLACLPRRNESHQAAATMRPKLRKCCGESAAYERNSCVGIETDSPMSLEEEQALLLAGANGKLGNLTAGMEIVSGFPVCPRLDNFTIVGDMRDAVLQPDASLLVDGQHIPTEEFCVERLRGADSQLQPPKVFACSEHAAKGSGLPARDIRFTLYPVGFIISAIFLAATLAAGWLLPASHHVLHWRCQTHHVACLMLGDISMAVIQLAGNSLQGEFCRALAILAHFFFLATFFWLNTMCFNIWWTFRDLRPASLEKGQELLRLRFYGAYAWGGPLIVAGLAAFLDHLPQTPGQAFLRPRFGEKQCWFYGDMEILAYFFGPIGVLLAINLLFFAATARELTCGLWKGEFVKSTTER